jgi:transposase InsO family protein
VIDLATRMVVGWQLADHMRTSPVVDALTMAIDAGHVQHEAIFHSDSETVPAGVPRVLTRTAMDTTGCWCLGAPRGS